MLNLKHEAISRSEAYDMRVKYLAGQTIRQLAADFATSYGTAQSVIKGTQRHVAGERDLTRGRGCDGHTHAGGAY